MAHPFLERAAQHTAQARAINDEFEGKEMPAEAARQMEAHLAKSADYRHRVEREANLKAAEEWISEPQYKHDMTGGEAIANEFGHGAYMLDSEKKELGQKAFLAYVRKGAESLSPEMKAALVEDSDGQKLVPTDYAGTIQKVLARDGVIRNLATVRPTSSKFVDIGNVTVNSAGWGVLETGATATDPMGTPNKDTITVQNLNALVTLGRDELDDADANLEEIIRQAVAAKFVEMEDDAFAAGTGSAQPFGITHGVTQSVTAAAGETVTSDDLVKLTYAVTSAKFRKNGVFLGHSSAEQAVSLLKDGNGNYIWRDRFAEGKAPTVLGYSWYTVDGLASMSATDDTGAGTNASVVFGDVRNGYMIADRRQLSVQRLVERYAEAGKIGLLFTQRVGGDVIRPAALAKYLL